MLYLILLHVIELRVNEFPSIEDVLLEDVLRNEVLGDAGEPCVVEEGSAYVVICLLVLRMGLDVRVDDEDSESLIIDGIYFVSDD